MLPTTQPALPKPLPLPTPAVHPFVDITAKKAPVLSNFRRRQFTNSGKFIDGGLRYPEEPRHLHHGENFTFPSATLVSLDRCCCRYVIIHAD